MELALTPRPPGCVCDGWPAVTAPQQHRGMTGYGFSTTPLHRRAPACSRFCIAKQSVALSHMARLCSQALSVGRYTIFPVRLGALYLALTTHRGAWGTRRRGSGVPD
jgi:hypothetical protein